MINRMSTIHKEEKNKNEGYEKMINHMSDQDKNIKKQVTLLER
jgi:hypothetical protein